MLADDGYGMRTIEWERWGEKVLLPGVDWEWTEDLLEDQYENENERLGKQGRASQD